MLNTIRIQKTSITDLCVDCVVNAANDRLQQGVGVCGAIFAAAGAFELQMACDRYGYCPTGDAVITPDFQLKAKHIIHAVGPIWVDGKHNEPELLYSCYERSMQLAMLNGCHSIAFPLISAGIYGYPKEEAWEIAIRAIIDFQQEHEEYRLDVIVAVLDDVMFALGNAVLDKHLEANDAEELESADALDEEEEDSQEDYVTAHKFSIYNKEQITKSSKCGCFCCIKIFNPDEIEEWIDPDEDTALCPYCDIDSVLGDASGYEITEEFLRKMNERWF